MLAARFTRVQLLVDVVAGNDEEWRGGGAAVLDAGSVQRVPLKLEHVDLPPYAYTRPFMKEEHGGSCHIECNKGAWMINKWSSRDLNIDLTMIGASSLTLYHWIRYLVGHLGAVDSRLADGHGVGLGDYRDDGDSEADLVHEFEVRGADPGHHKQ